MRRPQTKVVYDDNSDEEDDNLSYRSDEDELLDDSPSDLEEEALGNDSDYVEELPDDDDGDDGSYCTESSFRSHSTLGSTPGTFICAVLQTCVQILKVEVLFSAYCRNQDALFKMELARRNGPLFTVCATCPGFAEWTFRPVLFCLTFCVRSTVNFLRIFIFIVLFKTQVSFSAFSRFGEFGSAGRFTHFPFIHSLLFL